MYLQPLIVIVLMFTCGGRAAGNSSDTSSDTAAGAFAVVVDVPQIVFENQQVTFNCSAEGVGVVSYTWTRDNITVVADSEDPELTLQVPLAWNGSCLTCHVEADNGDMANASSILRVFTRRPTILTYPRDQILDEGEQLLLSCSAVGLPTPLVYFNIDGSPSLPTGSPVVLNRTASGDDSGVYFCKAQNSLATVMSPQALIRVRFGPEIIIGLPGDEDINVLNNTVAVLNCSVRGDPAPTVSWFHNGELISDDDDEGRVEVHANGSLIIWSVMLSDMGMYQCMAQNDLGIVQSDLATLMVNVFPMFVRTPTAMSVPIGTRAELACSANGIPEPTYEWQRCTEDDSVPLQLDDRVTEVNGTLTFNPTRLEDAGEYKCVAMNEYGEISSLPAELVILAPPPPPEALGGTPVGSSGLLLHWAPPTNPVPPVIRYIVEYRLTFELPWTEVLVEGSLSEVTVTGLYPNAVYQVRIRAESVEIVGVGEVSDTVEVMTSPGAPLAELLDGPENVTVTAVALDMLHVTWTIPRVLALTAYNHTTLSVQNGTGDEVWFEEMVSSPTVVTELTPFTEYVVTLTFVFVGGAEGTPVNMTATTLEGAPGDPPTGITSFALGRTSIRVQWAPPLFPNGQITRYAIYYLSPSAMFNITVGGGVMSHDLDGLLPYTNYTITVSASTSVGEGPAGPEGGVVVTTAQDVPPVPRGVSVMTLTSTSISVAWQLFAGEDVPGILTNYTVCYYGSVADITCLEISPQQNSVEVSDLVPFTLYSVTVAAATQAGLGQSTSVFNTSTLQDVPRAVVSMVVVVEVCPVLRIQWAPPDPLLLGGPESEVMYVVCYTPTGGRPVNQTFAYNSSLTSYVLEGLEAFTLYDIQLALSNDQGIGPISDSVSNTTCDGAAPPPINVVAQELNSSSIMVSWEAPPTVPGILQGYVLRYGRRGQPAMQTSVDSRSFVITDLIPFTEYVVGVASQTRGPLGNFSADQLVLTEGDVPLLAVSNVSVMATCPSNLLVEWSPLTPQQLRAPANNTRYVVCYSSNSSTGNTSVPYSQGPMVNLTDLEIDSEYSVAVKVVNSYGEGPSSVPQSATTLQQGAPAMPINVRAMATSRYVLQVSWGMSSAVEQTYTVHYSRTSTANIAEIMTWSTISPDPLSSQQVELEGLVPFTNYSIVIVASTLCGTKQSALVIGTTAEAPPTAPLPIRVVAVLPTGVKVRWSRPARPNGIITHYNVDCGEYTTEVSVSLLTYECTGLDPETEYIITVTAENGAGVSLGAPTSATTSCSLAAPFAEETEMGVVSIRLRGSCSISSAYFLVVVQELVSYADNTYDSPSRTTDSYQLKELLALTVQYQRRIEGRERRQALNEGGGVYIAANLSETMLRSGFTLGDSMRYANYTNHPLLPQVFYNLALRGTVMGTDTPVYTVPMDPISVSLVGTTSLPTFPLVPVVAGAGAGAVLILAICVVALMSCICCCCTRNLDKVDGVTGIRIERTGSFRLSKKKPQIDPVEEYRGFTRTEALEDHPPVPVFGFINKLMVMRTNDNQLFLEEFGSIPMTMPQLSVDMATMSINKPRNRYNNILPYDTSRVRLKGSQDYINASYVSGYRKPRAYIASQGPLKETVNDFWRMVWEDKVKTIVMLTNTQEKGKIKCEMYWPREVGSSSVHGHMDLTLAAVTTLADYSIRTLILQKVGSSKEPREVKQFHFTSWPDHGVPQYATAMLSMLRRVRAHYSPEEGPMLVHCSAGVGRTGTFIVIDTMLQRLMHEEETLDIYGHVTLLRTQRNYMIQTEDQYFFVHEAIAEALLCGNTEVALDNLPGYVETLYSVIPDDESETTNLELQFKRLALDRNDPHRWITANKDANKTKNRFVNVLPYDSSRVGLAYSPGVDGSDYINASHVDSYHSRRGFIATQGPLTNTVEDFWRMLWEYSAPVVIMLTEEVEKGRECSAGYWPRAILQPVNYGKLKVELNAERNSGIYTYRDLAVTHTVEGDQRLVRHFQFHGWPEVGVPSPVVLIEFLREVQKLCQSLPSPHGPIVVHCSNGVGRTGVFLSLHIILERMLVEGLVDVFQTVKNLRIQRPAMVQTLEQYHLCYDAAVTFQQSSECLYTPPQPLVMTRHVRGSRHGSHSSSDSRKKSKNGSPTRSPTRSISQQRNTPMRSESFKESQKELGASGGAHVYGGSEATSTFGSHPTPVSESVTSASAVPVSAQPTSVAGSYTPNMAGSHTPNMAVSHTPNVSGSEAVVTAGQYPQVGDIHSTHVQAQAYSDCHTPVVHHHVSATPTGQVLAHYYEPSPHTPSQKTMFVPSPSPVLHTLSQAPIYAGSQSSMYTGGSQTPALSGSQSLSMYGATGGSQTPPPSMMQMNNTSQYNTSTSTAHNVNAQQQYHQLVETHTPIATSHMDPAVAAESTPL